MAKTIKNISLSTLACRLVRSAGLGRGCDFRVFDLDSGWRPSPHDIQITVQRKRQPGSEHNFIQFHQRFVLKLHIAGESTGYIEEKFLRFRPGEGILIFPFQIHRIASVPTPGGQLRVLANFTLSPEDQAMLMPLRDRIFTIDDELVAAIGKLVTLSAEGSAGGGDHEAVACLSSMLVALREKVLREPAVAAAPGEASPGAGLFECIRDRYRTGMPVKELAARLGVSEGSVRRRFLRETGKSPGRTMRELRLKEAAELLRTTREPVREIGERCGFSTPFSFSRAFRNRFGVSPRAFRNGDPGTLPADES